MDQLNHGALDVVLSTQHPTPHFCDNPAALMEHNPYAAPRTEVKDVDPVEERQQLATKLQRMSNLLIDTLAFFALMVLVLIAGQLVSPTLGQKLVSDNVLF